MSVRRRMAAAAFGVCMLAAYVGVPAQAASAPTGSEMFVSDPELDSSGKAFNQQAPVAVFTGSGWYVVWAEDRGTGIEVFGGRVGTDGSHPDGTGVRIATGAGVNDDARNPAVALGKNGQVLVTWLNTGPSGQDIYAARVSASGQVLDPQPIPISVGTAEDTLPRVAFNGDVFLIVFMREAQTTSAVLVDGSSTSLPIQVGFLLFPDVAASGSTFLVVGALKSDSIVGRRMAGSGGFLGGTFAISSPRLPGRQNQVTVAGSPDRWVATWTDERNTTASNGDIFATRIAHDGTVLDTNGFEVNGLSGPQDHPRVAMQGDAALIAWHDRRANVDIVAAARVSAGGDVKEPDGVTISGGVVGAVMQGPAKGFAVVYQRQVNGDPFGGAARAAIRTVSAK